MFDDDQETPNTITCTYEFDEGGKKKMMVFEVRHWITNNEAGIHEFDQSVKSNTIGNLFYGSNGYLAIDGYVKYQTWLGKEQEPGPFAKQGGDHFANFINAVRSRRREEPTRKLKKVRFPRPSCIWPTFRTSLAVRCTSTRTRIPAPAMPKQPGCLPASTALRLSSRNWCKAPGRTGPSVCAESYS